MVYISLKCLKHELVEFVLATVEGAYRDVEKAQHILQSLPAVWQETIDNVPYQCERAVHTVNLNQQPIYVLVKLAKHESGDFAVVITEAVFDSEQQAKVFTSSNQAVWTENFANALCYGERVIFSVNLE